jgi:hypothetical protein
MPRDAHGRFEQLCEVQQPDGAHRCTRPAGHDGPHVATVGPYRPELPALATWPAQRDVDAAVAMGAAMRAALAGGLACDLCGDQGPLLLKARCHLTAPLQVVLDGDTLILKCYLPDCGREVARFQIARGDVAEQLRLAWNARGAADAKAVESRLRELVAGEIVGAGIARHVAEAVHALDRGDVTVGLGGVAASGTAGTTG